MVPASMVSMEAVSKASPKRVKSGVSSIWPRFFKAKDHAKIRAMGLVDVYHPEAIQILDYYHACEYLGAALGSIEIIEKKKESMFAKLLEGKVVAIIAFLKTQKQTKEITDCIRYYSHHQMRMRYQLYIDQGLDIGSGAIESTHRTLIQARMKQAGMHWKKKNVQSVASVRARVQSDRWDEIVNKHLKAA